MKQVIIDTIKYIDEHIEESLKLDDIADEMGYSKFHFSRIFKKYMNQTVNEYVMEKRLRLAAKDIMSGQRILDVAVKYHYSTHTGFSKAFKKCFSYNPSMLSSIKLLESMLLQEGRTTMTKKELYDELAEYFRTSTNECVEKEFEDVYKFADASLSTMKRYSGEEYVTHPLNVGLILTKMGVSTNTIFLGILHDCMNHSELEKHFGKIMLKKVKRIQELSNFNLLLEEVDFEKEEDLLLVKLADRLHNMQTIRFIDEKRWQVKAKETLDVFSPLAVKIGQTDLKIQLDKLSLDLFQ
ncbi:HD domain-containing protein [Acidaminobacter sp. JC074]|uniref:HD domain-containing protein n=1 Tax=Acidaminobacter sp. JC074 TaxID=2530199 RepID=UPI001F10373A|nr:HD domain-containing protein [Acidaminobacter sp. JC074]MCH4891078.1 HD domain-containing protein [Acidaminobacter sp. JC074]